MRSSLIIVGFFILGSLLGYFGVIPTSILEGDISFYALGALMFCVGISLGSDPETLKSFKKINPLLHHMPLLTIIGTVAGSAIVSIFLPERSAIDSMAVGSGLGYYSLSSIFITEFKGAELGTIALLSNISREILALLLAPVFVKYFGKLAPISAGGTTNGYDITYHYEIFRKRIYGFVRLPWICHRSKCAVFGDAILFDIIDSHDATQEKMHIVVALPERTLPYNSLLLN